MHTSNDPAARPAAAPPQACGDAPAGRRAGVANACVAALLLALALGALAVECGLYRAFDDNWLDLDRSAWPSVLAILGLGTAPPHPERGR